MRFFCRTLWKLVCRIKLHVFTTPLIQGNIHRWLAPLCFAIFEFVGITHTDQIDSAISTGACHLIP